MDLVLLVGNTAVICTVISNFAGVSVCLDIFRRKSTSNISSLPFLASAINGSLWIQYGYVAEDNVLVVVNVIAFFLQCSYLACYYYSTSDKLAFTQLLLSATAFMFLVHGYSFYYAQRPVAVQTLGLLSSGGSIASAAAPLAVVKEVFQTRSTKNLPFLIILGMFIVTSLWFTYGVLIGDAFVKVPNLIGAVLSGFQLSLFLIFDSKEFKSD